MSSEDLGALSKTQAIDRFDDYDWTTELTWLGELRCAGAPRGPPGMGLVDSSPRVLQLCPLSTTRRTAHYHFLAPKGLGRWLGSRRTESLVNGPWGLAAELIAEFYRSRHDEFLAEIGRLQKERL